MMAASRSVVTDVLSLQDKGGHFYRLRNGVQSVAYRHSIFICESVANIRIPKGQ